MHKPRTSLPSAIQEYLQTGCHDVNYLSGSGRNFIEAERHVDRQMRDALIRTVFERLPGQSPTQSISTSDLVALTRSKVTPMVNGLFPLAERMSILAMLEKSVVFLTSENIESTLRSSRWLHTAWSLANMYLHQCGSDLLSTEAVPIVGLSEETTCYLSLDYFNGQDEDPFSDYLVHEAAHVFHNCKRETVGLKETRTKDFLLDIDFRKRELFAYSCEAYSRIVSMEALPKARRLALQRHFKGPLPSRNVVDRQDYLDILTDALTARNGWKWILKECAPKKSTTGFNS